MSTLLLESMNAAPDTAELLSNEPSVMLEEIAATDVTELKANLQFLRIKWALYGVIIEGRS